LEGRVPILRDRATQAAGFRVLKAPDVPSILLELGFLSNPRDRARLLSDEGRKALIEGIAEGAFAWVEAQDGARYAPARRARGG
ncbi:MAG: N-acetylmuramoyl-L-alanine amidase, partial [Pseudomonadota bacterium]